MGKQAEQFMNAVAALAAAAGSKIGPGAAQMHSEVILATVAELERRYELLSEVRDVAEAVADPAISLPPGLREQVAHKLLAGILEPLQALFVERMRHGTRWHLSARIIETGGAPELAKFMHDFADTEHKLGEEGLRVLRAQVEKLNDEPKA